MLRSHLGLQYASDSLPTTNQTAATAAPPPSHSYDVEGRKLEKRGRRDRLERHIAMADSLGKVRWAAVGLAKDKLRLSSRAAGQWRCPTTSKHWLGVGALAVPEHRFPHPACLSQEMRTVFDKYNPPQSLFKLLI